MASLAGVADGEGRLDERGVGEYRGLALGPPVQLRRATGAGTVAAGWAAVLHSEQAVLGEPIEVSVPERRYDLVGRLLARAIADSIDSGAPVQEVLPHVAYRAGQTIGANADNLLAALEEAGYEPRRSDDDATLALGNCPFHRLAQSTALVCGVNLQLLRGVIDGVGDAYLALPEPSPSHCCVRLRPCSP
jgi:hypothetical protein